MVNAWLQRRKGHGLASGSFWRNLSRDCLGLGLEINREEVPSLLLWSQKGSDTWQVWGSDESTTTEFRKGFLEEETLSLVRLGFELKLHHFLTVQQYPPLWLSFLTD